MIRGPSLAISTFEGFRSRCTTPAAWIAPSPSASVSTEATGNGPWTAPHQPATDLQRSSVTSRGSGPSRVSIHHRGGEAAAHPPRGDHLPREPGPETRTGRQLSPDQLHRHQPAPGDPPAPSRRCPAVQQPVLPGLHRIPGLQRLHYAITPKNQRSCKAAMYPRLSDQRQPCRQCAPQRSAIGGRSGHPASRDSRRGRRVAVSCCPAQ